MGWTTAPPHDRIATLCQLGMDQATATILAAEIEKGSLLDDLHVPAETIDMIRSAHSATWFQLHGISDYLRTCKGGRQGCPLGALIFNIAYARVLYLVEVDLFRHGIPLQLPGSGTDVANMLQSTYVDDQTYAFCLHRHGLGPQAGYLIGIAG